MALGQDRAAAAVARHPERVAEPGLHHAGAEPAAAAELQPARDAAVSYGPSASQLTRHVLRPPSTDVDARADRGGAGTIWVAAAPRTWETARSAAVSWFPAGAATAAVASPAPGSQIGPGTPITLTFSKPIAKALGQLAAAGLADHAAGRWQQIEQPHDRLSARGLRLRARRDGADRPAGGVKLVGGQATGAADNGTWTVSGRLDDAPAAAAGDARLPAAAIQRERTGGEHAAGPGERRDQAAEGELLLALPEHPRRAAHHVAARNAPGEMTKGAVMAFENDQGMTADGVAGPAVWKALMAATIAGQRLDLRLHVRARQRGQPRERADVAQRRDGRLGPVNTGIPAAPTAQGMFAVFEHAPSVTMSGTNPDGSHYSDPGVPYVSYFNGGDALHGFLRGVLRVRAEPRLRRDAVLRGRRGLPVHADRDARRRHVGRRAVPAGMAASAANSAAGDVLVRVDSRARGVRRRTSSAGPSAPRRAAPTRSTPRSSRRGPTARELEPAAVGVRDLRRYVAGCRSGATRRARSRASSPRCARCCACRSSSGRVARTRPSC